MEQLVESFVALFCHENDLEYLPQGSVKSIKETWGVDVKIGKAGKNIDFVIYKKSTGTLYFIECNFYNGNISIMVMGQNLSPLHQNIRK